MSDKRIIELIELLAEYMRKTDKILERMEKHDILFEKQFNRMDLAYQIIVTHSEKIEELQRESIEIKKETNKIKKETRQQELRNEALFNEIISLSKRVQTVEGKQ